MSMEIVKKCRKFHEVMIKSSGNPGFQGINFKRMDILNIWVQFFLIISNANLSLIFLQYTRFIIQSRQTKHVLTRNFSNGRRICTSFQKLVESHHRLLGMLALGLVAKSLTGRRIKHALPFKNS